MLNEDGGMETNNRIERLELANELTISVFEYNGPFFGVQISESDLSQLELEDCEHQSWILTGQANRPGVCFHSICPRHDL